MGSTGLARIGSSKPGMLAADKGDGFDGSVESSCAGSFFLLAFQSYQKLAWVLANFKHQGPEIERNIYIYIYVYKLFTVSLYACYRGM